MEASTYRAVLPIFKEFALLGHFLKHMCHQHLQPRCGAVIDSFLQLKNSRRTIPLNRVAERSQVENALSNLIQQNPASKLAMAINAAKKDNTEMDRFYSKTESMDTCSATGKKFSMLSGAPFKSPAVPQKQGSS